MIEDAATFASTIAPPRVPRRRLAISGDGSVTGDESSQLLGADLRYACRMAAQIEPLLDLGPLQWVSTLSGTAVTARVATNDGAVTVVAEIEEHEPVAALRESVVDADSAHAAIRKALHRVRSGLQADWCALITWDKRLVGALLAEDEDSSPEVTAVLSEVGLRAMAVLASFEESYRETAVVLEYAHGSLIVVAVDGDVLFAFAETIDKSLAGPVIGDVRSLLAPHDLDLVWAWGAWMDV